jgi:hypothetical protein
MAVSGIVLTKLDGTAKGGVILGIADQLKIPVRYIGIGEKVEDLRPFDPDESLTHLYERPSTHPRSRCREDRARGVSRKSRETFLLDRQIFSGDICGNQRLGRKR